MISEEFNLDDITPEEPGHWVAVSVNRSFSMQRGLSVNLELMWAPHTIVPPIKVDVDLVELENGWSLVPMEKRIEAVVDRVVGCDACTDPDRCRRLDHCLRYRRPPSEVVQP
jgi:hypothetical protein